MKESDQPSQRPGRRMPSLWALAEYWSKQDVFEVRLWWPHCFGCQGWISPLDIGPDTPLKVRWKKAMGHLERAHLVTRALDGLDGCQNIVPLCCRCHRAMPKFGLGDGQRAIAWVKERQWEPEWLEIVGRRIQQENDDIIRRFHRKEPERSCQYLADLAGCSIQHAWKIVRTMPADWRDPIQVQRDEEQQEVARIRASLRELEELAAAGELTERSALIASTGLRKRLAEAEGQEVEPRPLYETRP